MALVRLNLHEQRVLFSSSFSLLVGRTSIFSLVVEALATTQKATINKMNSLNILSIKLVMSFTTNQCLIYRCRAAVVAVTNIGLRLSRLEELLRSF